MSVILVDDIAVLVRGLFVRIICVMYPGHNLFDWPWHTWNWIVWTELE